MPLNVESGYYNKDLFYLISEYFPHHPLVSGPQKKLDTRKIYENIQSIIEFSELIQNLKRPTEVCNYRKLFLEKTTSWFNAIPKHVKDSYKVNRLLNIVTENIGLLGSKPRHGDFAPWHLLSIDNDKLCLIDGEHFQDMGVEYYDICYFIQRVFSVLDDISLAKNIYSNLLKKRLDHKKLKIVLAARGIGGYLDESFSSSPNYSTHSSFQRWTENV